MLTRRNRMPQDGRLFVWHLGSLVAEYRRRWEFMAVWWKPGIFGAKNMAGPGILGGKSVYPIATLPAHKPKTARGVPRRKAVLAARVLA